MEKFYVTVIGSCTKADICPVLKARKCRLHGGEFDRSSKVSHKGASGGARKAGREEAKKQYDKYRGELYPLGNCVTDMSFSIKTEKKAEAPEDTKNG